MFKIYVYGRNYAKVLEWILIYGKRKSRNELDREGKYSKNHNFKYGTE